MQLPPEMYTTYILRRQGDYELLESAIQNLDIAAFRKIGHQIKGNASSFGFDDLSLLGNKMHNLEEAKIRTD